MTIKELIVELNRYPTDAEVMILYDSDDQTFEIKGLIISKEKNTVYIVEQE